MTVKPLMRRLEDLKIVLPKVSGPFGAYVPARLVGNLAYVLGHAPDTVNRLNQYLELNTAVVNGIRPSLPNLLTAVVEGQSVVNGKDANGHYVRVLALSGACTAAPDPSHNCSTPAAAPSSSAPAGGSTAPSAPPGPRGDAYQPMTDAELSALFLGS